MGAARPLLGWGLLAVAVVLAIAALRPAHPARAQQRDPDAPTAAELTEGAELYAVFCASCHGSDGLGGVVEGTGRRAPALAERPDEVTVPYVDLVVRVGRMPPAGDPFDNRARNRDVIDERERELLVAYLTREFDLEGEIPNPPEGEARRGLEVYDTNCAQCHGSTGAGGVAGRGAYTPQINQYPPVTIAEAIRVGPFQMPQFDRTTISDQEVGDIAAFLDHVQEESGTPLFRLTELNPVYASAYVFVLALVILASVVWIAGRPAWFPDPQPPQAEEDAS
jgi:ubiquinol-cytochrome c reductase cytochrome c subunit